MSKNDKRALYALRLKERRLAEAYRAELGNRIELWRAGLIGLYAKVWRICGGWA